jgi:hypothetical protein
LQAGKSHRAPKQWRWARYTIADPERCDLVEVIDDIATVKAKPAVKAGAVQHHLAADTNASTYRAAKLSEKHMAETTLTTIQ